MALFLYVLFPFGWLLTGKLLGSACALTFPTERGRAAARAIGLAAMVLLPVLYFTFVFLGLSGNAGSGIRLFGSEELAELLGLPWYTVTALAAYAIAACVIRDLMRGLRPGIADISENHQ